MFEPDSVKRPMDEAHRIDTEGWRGRHPGVNQVSLPVVPQSSFSPTLRA